MSMLDHLSPAFQRGDMLLGLAYMTLFGVSFVALRRSLTRLQEIERRAYLNLINTNKLLDRAGIPRTAEDGRR